MKYLALIIGLFGCSNQVIDSQESTNISDVSEVSYPTDPVVVEPIQQTLSDITICLYDVAPETQQAIISGLESFAKVLKPWRNITVNPNGSNCNVTVYEVGQYSNLCASEDAMGCTRQIGGMTEDSVDTEIFLYRNNYEKYATGAVMHEMGHLLGLTHKDGGLMQASWNKEWADPYWSVPDQQTINRLEKLLKVELNPI